MVEYTTSLSKSRIKFMYTAAVFLESENKYTAISYFSIGAWELAIFSQLFFDRHIHCIASSIRCMNALFIWIYNDIDIIFLWIIV